VNQFEKLNFAHVEKVRTCVCVQLQKTNGLVNKMESAELYISEATNAMTDQTCGMSLTFLSVI